jgi:uncharacterized protein YndB with AHSA1/START domain
MGKQDNHLIIPEVIDATVDSVFAAWTNPEQLEQWFPPNEYSVRFKEFNIQPGGASHYCLVSTSGLEIWRKNFYQEVRKPFKLVYTHCHSDENGGIQRHPMMARWPVEILTTVLLEEQPGNKTLLKLTLEPVNASMDEIMAFHDGIPELNQEWGGTIEQLANYFSGQ